VGSGAVVRLKKKVKKTKLSLSFRNNIYKSSSIGNEGEINFTSAVTLLFRVNRQRGKGFTRILLDS
jgi:hypothetical protein